MRKPLTKKLVEAAIEAGVPAGQAHVMVWDASPSGFGLRIRKGGGASWLYTYRPKGSPRGTAARVMTLGTWPTLSVDAARTLAIELAGKVAGGSDPAKELKQQKARERSVVGQALDDYQKSLEQRRIVNTRLVMAALRQGFAPVLGNDLDTLGLRDVVGLIDRIANRKHRRKDGTIVTTPGAGREFRKLAHGFLGWAALQGLTPANVLAGLRTPKQSREEKRARKAREGRALDDREIAAVWNASLDMGAFGALVRMGILTGLRRNELAELRWTDVRDDMIVVPDHRTKMGKEHRIPLTSTMKANLRTEIRSANGLVFPSAVTDNVMSGWSKMLPKLVEASGVSFRLHDTRRTTRTLMSRLGVDEATAELAIGHSRGGLVAIYDKHARWNERVEAFERVSNHVAAMIAGDSGAIPLRTR